jgi:hypothetical protein
MLVMTVLLRMGDAVTSAVAGLPFPVLTGSAGAQAPATVTCFRFSFLLVLHSPVLKPDFYLQEQ